MEEKYKDAIDRAFQGDEAIVGDWVREARSKLLDIQQQLDNMGEKPTLIPSPKPTGTPVIDKFSKWIDLEKQKQAIYEELNAKVDKQFSHKSKAEMASIKEKTAKHADINNQKLKKKDIEAAQNAFSGLTTQKYGYEQKASINTEEMSKSADRFANKLRSAKELGNKPDAREEKITSKDNSEKKEEIGSQALYKSSGSFSQKLHSNFELENKSNEEEKVLLKVVDKDETTSSDKYEKSLESNMSVGQRQLDDKEISAPKNDIEQEPNDD